MSDNHSIAYSIIGYLCAYYRYYYPGEFITAYLNIYSAKEEEVRNGAILAKTYGINMTTPKFGLSEAEYVYDSNSNTIARGLGSIKYIPKKLATQLYNAAQSNRYNHFVDFLRDKAAIIDARQMEILIKLDFFSEFGTQKELRQIVYIFNNLLKGGNAKSIRKERVSDLGLDAVFARHATGTTKAGDPSKSWTNLDIVPIMHEAEEHVLALHIPDLSLAEKARNYAEVAGYVGFVTGSESDRSTLFVTEVKPLKRKKDGQVFGSSIYYKSIGSGIDGRMTVFKSTYDKDPIKEGDVIRCLKYRKDKQYFQLLSYVHIV